jgi:hypothetical protein
MAAVIKAVFAAPLATLFIVAGMLFLLIGVVGNISGKIEPGEKARLVSGVMGLLFIALGLGMHLLQKPPSVSESPEVSLPPKKAHETGNPPQAPSAGPSRPTPKTTPSNQPVPTKEASNTPIPTVADGVVASVMRFEKSGELVMLQLMVRNTSRQARMVCFSEAMTNLIDEATGESWRPKESVGQPCTTLDANTPSRMWMRFDVPNPEQRTFSVSSPLLKGTLDDLMLVGPS